VALWAPPGPSYERLGAFWRARSSKKKKKLAFFELYWGRFGIQNERFWGVFLFENSIGSSSDQEEPELAVKPKRYYFYNTCEPFKDFII